MSPASYQTAPPRVSMVATGAERRQVPSAPAASPTRARGGPGGGSGQRGGLLDQLVGGLDLGLVGPQITGLEGLLRGVEMLLGLRQEAGQVLAGLRGLSGLSGLRGLDGPLRRCLPER